MPRRHGIGWWLVHGGRFGLPLLEHIWIFLGIILWSFLGSVTMVVRVGLARWAIACGAKSKLVWGECGFLDLVTCVSQGSAMAVGRFLWCKCNGGGRWFNDGGYAGVVQKEAMCVGVDLCADMGLWL